MNKIMIALAATLALFTVTACKKKGGGAAGEALAKYEAWTKAMCACKEGDTACAKKVTDEQIKWGEEQAKSADKNAKVDPKEAEEMAAKMKPIMDEFTKCSMKAMTPPATPEVKKDEPPATPEVKKDEPAKPDEAKKDEPAKPDEAKKDEPKKDEPKKDEAKKDEKKGGW
jgi:hypothetical protein